MLKIYIYKNCSTCRKALQWLDKAALSYQEIAIRETPPSPTEIQRMLDTYHGELKKLFNTSGMDYRALNLKEKLPSLSPKEAIELLASHGNLVKRPFAIGPTKAVVGFKEEEWKQTFLS